MLFKLIFIGGLVYLLYRMVMPASLPPSDKTNVLNDRAEEDEYIDYEDLD